MAGTDDIFNRLGPWHYPIILFCALRGLPAAYHVMGPTFMAPTLDHWCAKPEQLANWTDQEWIDRAIPLVERGARIGEKSRCEMYAFEESDGGRVTILNDTRLFCSSWDYDLGDNIHTLTNQYNLVCDRVWLRAASQGVFMFGVMVGNIVFSHISDWFGRKRALLYMLPLPLVAGLLQAVSPTYFIYNIGRFVASVGIGGIQNTAFTLMMEVLSARHRALGSLISSGGWTLGLVTLTPFAWFIRDWVHLQVFMSLFFLINTTVWFFIPESPRWLLATRKYQRAGRVLKRAIKRNKVADVDLHGVIKDYEDRIEQEKMTKKPTFMALFRYRCIRRTTVIKSAMSLLDILLYYNLTYSSILIGANPYVSFLLMALMEIPVRIIAVLIVNYVKRRTSYVVLYGFTALCSLSAIFLPKDPWWLQLSFVLCAKFGALCGNAVNAVQLSELFPTKIRTLATGFMSVASRIGAILAPFTKELGVIVGPWAPRAVDCSACVAIAALGLFLPETFKATLPDTIEDVKVAR
ncbi:unnamed protein product [Ixodes hexagonus]